MHSRTFKDSGNIVVTNDSPIVANDIYAFDIDKRFTPYEQVSVINNSDADVKIAVNYSNDFKFIIPKGNQRVLDVTIQDIKVTNVGSSTINANEIIINLRHTGETEKNKIKDGLQTLSQFAMLRNFL